MKLTALKVFPWNFEPGQFLIRFTRQSIGHCLDGLGGS